MNESHNKGRHFNVYDRFDIYVPVYLIWFSKKLKDKMIFYGQGK